MTRVAVVGVGTMGRNHVRVYSEIPDAELAAIVDQNTAAAESLSRMYHVPLYSDFREMVERERPEAISVAVPTEFHYEVVKQLLEMGCNVLVEKPIAATLSQAWEMIDLANQKGVVLTVGHIERFNPAVIDLKRRLENGELGRVFQVHARRVGPFPTRIQDVGVIKDLAIHDLDIMHYLTGTYVNRVYAEARSTLHESCEDMFVGTLHFLDNTLGLLEINWLTPTKIRELYITGDRGMFRVNYITQDLCFFENAEYTGSDWTSLSLIRGVSEGSIIQYAIKKKEPLRTELETFIAHIQGKDARVVSGMDAIEALQIAMALVESAKMSKMIKVDSHDSFQFPSTFAKGSVLYEDKGGPAAAPGLQTGN
ncbi:MAG: Gfo/Idh/MocA family oxidoreductase [Chloroflexi bacterium]|nr:Gfo/Idh/MocA family oxidoreductase [Chloroflexota bacterium]